MEQVAGVEAMGETVDPEAATAATAATAVAPAATGEVLAARVAMAAPEVVGGPQSRR